jgi:hypothetical protein
MTLVERHSRSFCFGLLASQLERTPIRADELVP